MFDIGDIKRSAWDDFLGLSKNIEPELANRIWCITLTLLPSGKLR